jgi:hypothetical protein
MKKIGTALLVMIFSPLWAVGYIGFVAFMMLWVGWHDADEFVTKEGIRFKDTTRSKDREGK